MKGCMGTKGSMDQRKKPLCSPVTCVFLLFILLFFFCSLFFRFLSPFYALFSAFFTLFLLFFCPLFIAAPVRSLEGLIYSLNMPLFWKDSMH